MSPAEDRAAWSRIFPVAGEILSKVSPDMAGVSFPPIQFNTVLGKIWGIVNSFGLKEDYYFKLSASISIVVFKIITRSSILHPQQGCFPSYKKTHPKQEK
jgi:hypothetical protein